MEWGAPQPTLKRKQSGGHVSWDEDVLAEHDALRGTRGRIVEPKTPYRYPSDDDLHDDEGEH